MIPESRMPAPVSLSSLIASCMLLTACGGSFEGACWGICLEDETPEVRVVDGDTIEFDGDRWRLQGFDAPEAGQTCRDADGGEWACGEAATEALGELVSAGTVSCTDSGDDSYGRNLGSCSAGGVEFGAYLVREGHAVNDPRFGPDYADEEKEARDRGAGIHTGRHLAPWDWRAGDRLGDAMPGFLHSHDPGIDLQGLLPPEETGETESTANRRAEVGRYDPEAAEGTTEGTMDATAWGAWSGRGAFAVVDLGGDGDGDMDMDVDVLGISWAPHFPATNPKELDGAASWSGTMVGMDERDGAAVSGRAAIALEDFGRPTVDVTFTGIRGLDSDDSGARISAMEWRDLRVGQGAFLSDAPGSRIEGRFHGDRHQGVVGIFGHGRIVGAFGATRD